MSAESRLLRGDDPAGVAKLFNINEADMAELVKSLKPPKKKAARKKAVKAK